MRYDYYLWNRDIRRWMGVDFFGLIDQLTSSFNTFGAVLAGRTVSKGAYEEALKRATYDEDFG